MSAALWVGIWLGALVGGALAVLLTRTEERRWSAVGSLAIAFGVSIGLSAATGWGAAPLEAGVISVRAVTVTVGPAMILAAIGLVLVVGRRDAGDTELAWLLGVLACESFALLAATDVLLIGAELAACVVLVLHARAQGQRAHLVYLGASALLMSAALPVAWSGDHPELLASLLIGAACLRLGLFPFSTGALASLEGGLSLKALLPSLPFGGVLLLARVSPLLAERPALATAICVALLGSAPLAGALAVSQQRLGRSLGYTFAAAHALIAAGVLDAAGGQLGGHLLWAATLLTACGLGASAHLVALRVGDPDLGAFHGLHGSAPALSLAFLLFAVALAGAPGTVDFVADDVLLNTVHGAGLLGMALVVITLALLGFNALRLQFHVFYGANTGRFASAALDLKGRERMGLTLVGLVIVLGGVAPALLPLVNQAH